jgi:hypothetical protein
MRKQNETINTVRTGAKTWQALKSVPGGLPLMAFFLTTMAGATVYFAAMGYFCLGQGDRLWAAFGLALAGLTLTVGLLGVLSAVWKDRFPRFYRVMWCMK